MSAEQPPIDQLLEEIVPDEAIRNAAVEFFGSVIDWANATDPTAWYVRNAGDDAPMEIKIGKIVACKFDAHDLYVGVVGMTPAQKAQLKAKVGKTYQFADQAERVQIPLTNISEAAELLKPRILEFLESASKRVRSAIPLEDHQASVVEYISNKIGRPLPQPSTEDEISDEYEEMSVESSDPQKRGRRSPIFETTLRTISSLLDDIEKEDGIALPDMQRPFVWNAARARDLIDSLYLGFPGGTLVFWKPSSPKDAHRVGSGEATQKAQKYVIDGQQRLTSLFAIMRDQKVKGKDGADHKIKIAFRPRDGKFSVADAATDANPEYLSDVFEIWRRGSGNKEIRTEIFRRLEEKGRTVSDEYEDVVEYNLETLRNIENYNFPTVDIKSDSVTEEDIADVFVRINSKAVPLKRADFVMTLLSVFDPNLRDQIEERAESMNLDATQLLQVSCAVAFNRASMTDVYRILRGANPATGAIDSKQREARIKSLKEAAQKCMKREAWKEYTNWVRDIGFLDSENYSTNPFLNAYAFYILGVDAHVPQQQLKSLISRWLIGSIVTQRYSKSADTKFEQDLNVINKDDASKFPSAMEDELLSSITENFWNDVLVKDLATEKSNHPAFLVFRASQIMLGAGVLFGSSKMETLLGNPVQGSRDAMEAHHLFPKEHLKSIGINKRNAINQVANLAYVAWKDNSQIDSKAPSEYVPVLKTEKKIDDATWRRACAEHALPPGWETMDYDRFLDERRQRMAELIHIAYRKLGGEADAPPLTPPWFLPKAEEVWKRISEVERGLRDVIRKTYLELFGDEAAAILAENLSDQERQTLARAMRTRPEGTDPMSIVDFLYLGQLPPLMFNKNVWQQLRSRLHGQADIKKSLQDAISKIAPVRNDIAHMREVSDDQLTVAKANCIEVIRIIGGK